jgi:hypothetical protein
LLGPFVIHHQQDRTSVLVRIAHAASNIDSFPCEMRKHVVTSCIGADTGDERNRGPQTGHSDSLIGCLPPAQLAEDLAFEFLSGCWKPCTVRDEIRTGASDHYHLR